MKKKLHFGLIVIGILIIAEAFYTYASLRKYNDQSLMDAFKITQIALFASGICCLIGFFAKPIIALIAALGFLGISVMTTPTVSAFPTDLMIFTVLIVVELIIVIIKDRRKPDATQAQG